jgi:predicted RNase H-like HicB family nuclease
MQHTFTAVYVQGESGLCVAYIEELPGALAEGTTIEEARKNLREAVEMMLAANRRVTHADFASAQVLHRERLSVGR